VAWVLCAIFGGLLVMYLYYFVEGIVTSEAFRMLQR